MINLIYSELFLIASSPRGRPALPGALHLPHWNVIAASNVSLRDLRQQVVAIFCTDNCHCEGGFAARGNLL